MEEESNGENPVPPLALHRKDCSSREGLWTYFREAASEVKYPGLLWSFILHCEALPLIPLRNRAVRYQVCNPDLDAHLCGEFLPKIFSLIDVHISEWDLDFDLDGNIFTALLGILLSATELSLPQQLGDSLSQIAISVVSPLNDSPHLEALRSVFPVRVSPPQPPLLAAAPKKLLPFHHDVFDEKFSIINLPSDDPKEVIEYGALEFGKDTVFNDKFHWHNAKRHILPKHLGGEQAKPNNDWERMKMMRGHQRFISRLTADAATLTGAFGARFNRITIVTGKVDEAQRKYTGNPVRHTLVIISREG